MRTDGRRPGPVQPVSRGASVGGPSCTGLGSWSTPEPMALRTASRRTQSRSAPGAAAVPGAVSWSVSTSTPTAERPTATTTSPRVRAIVTAGPGRPRTSTTGRPWAPSQRGQRWVSATSCGSQPTASATTRRRSDRTATKERRSAGERNVANRSRSAEPSRSVVVGSSSPTGAQRTTTLRRGRAITGPYRHRPETRALGAFPLARRACSNEPGSEEPFLRLEPSGSSERSAPTVRAVTERVAPEDPRVESPSN